MVVCRQNLKVKSCEPLLGGLQDKHPLDVPAHRDQIPLALDIGEASQEKLTKPHCDGCQVPYNVTTNSTNRYPSTTQLAVTTSAAAVITRRNPLTP